MELLSVIRARSVCLFDLNELNPRWKAVYPELIQRLKDKYAFAKVPASQFDYEKDSNALAWIDGRFRVAEGFVSVDLRIYFDGVVVDTRSSTNDADLFLHEVFELVNSEFGL